MAIFFLVLVTLLAGCAKTLSHDGGVRLTFVASCLPAEPQCDVGGKIASVLDILKRRGIDGLQVPDTVVRQEGEGRIVVALPSYADTAAATSVLGTRGELVVVDPGGTQVLVGTSIIVDGITDIRSSSTAHSSAQAPYPLATIPCPASQS
jgi:preprotein translocase subunit SecD